MFQRTMSMLTGFLLVAAFSVQASAEEETYWFGKSDQRTTISFQSETAFETILGSTSKLEGHVVGDLETETCREIEVEVPVDSLRTGIDLRDEHLRSTTWLDAEAYPTISFRSEKAEKLSERQWRVYGTFTMHGVSREMVTIVSVRAISEDLAKKAGLEPGRWLRISTEFQVRLSDHGVEVPAMAKAKVSDTWSIKVQAFATTTKPEGAEGSEQPTGAGK